MPPRGFVLVFFFWALLSIITPTLIFWSASARPNLASQGESRDEMRTRRMMDSIENRYIKNKTTTFTQAPAPAPEPVPASPVPASMTTNETQR